MFVTDENIDTWLLYGYVDKLDTCLKVPHVWDLHATERIKLKFFMYNCIEFYSKVTDCVYTCVLQFTY